MQARCSCWCASWYNNALHRALYFLQRALLASIVYWRANESVLAKWRLQSSKRCHASGRCGRAPSGGRSFSGAAAPPSNGQSSSGASTPPSGNHGSATGWTFHFASHPYLVLPCHHQLCLGDCWLLGGGVDAPGDGWPLDWGVAVPGNDWPSDGAWLPPAYDWLLDGGVAASVHDGLIE